MEMPDCAEPEGSRLSHSLAMMLEPELQEALDHPVRREILRSVNRRGDPPAIPAEIASRLSRWRLAQLSYHAQVLTDAAALVGPIEEFEEPFPNEIGHFDHLTHLAERPQVVAVLQAMERPDRERWLPAASGFPTPGTNR